MQSFPEQVYFRHEWRPYQKRVIDALGKYLENGKLNLVAAPGSGKTVVGLEIARRLGKPALIIAPTITIREQWISRFVTHFLPSDAEPPSWLSTSLRSPGLITAITYQALHCACAGLQDVDGVQSGCDEDEADSAADSDEPRGRLTNLGEVVRLLREAGVETLVLDEAHHLRTNWWRSLQMVVERLDGITIVSLTATPPYDVSPAEWQRYSDLCGPIDAEISVPELVQDGHLCPHQDYVYLSTPSTEEVRQLALFREGAAAVASDIKASTDFIGAVAGHPWITSPAEHVEQILSEPEYCASMLVFLNSAGKRVPLECLDILGARQSQLPVLDVKWLEILLNGCFFKDAASYDSIAATIQEFEKRLKRTGAIERRCVRLNDSERTSRLLSGSIGKLGSICDIVSLESESMGTDLRAVILADFIRRAEMPSSRDDIRPMGRVGVVSAFEALRRRGIPGVKLGVLTGSLVIIPSELGERFQQECAERGVTANVMHAVPLGYCDGYLRVDIGGESRHSIVEVITQLFEDGGINALVGTKSLLGEGWDAPSINTLILASFVGSFMLSNQMRGRAIRTQPGNPDKTANIWHLVCIDEISTDAGSDYDTLVRRFQSFVGVSHDGATIENGIARLGLGTPPFSTPRIAEANSVTTASACDRQSLTEKWHNALSKGDGYMTDLMRIPEPVLPRRLVFANTVTAMVNTAVSTGICAFFEMMRARVHLDNLRDLFWYLVVLVGISVLVTLPTLLKALWLFAKHGTIERSMGSVADALLDSMCRCEFISTPREQIRARTHTDRGVVTCHLAGSTTYENNLFLTSLDELLGPIGNPRYLLVRKSAWHGFRQQDCHAVPAVLGVKAEYAQTLADRWRWSVGSATLIYTRNLEGRKALLHARRGSLSTAFAGKSQRLSCWQ